MNKSTKKHSISGKAMLATAALVAIQALPATIYAQTAERATTIQSNTDVNPIFMKERNLEQKLTIVGFDNGNPVYTNSRNQLFTINTKTGDLDYIKQEDFNRFACCLKIGYKYKSLTQQGSKDSVKIKLESAITNVTVVGADQEGHILQKNSKGRTFYLDPATGDMIYVK